MQKNKVATSFSSYPSDDLIKKALHADACMTDNVYFPNAEPLLVDLRSLTPIFVAANANTSNNTKEGTAAKKQARTNVELSLYALALHVQANGKNDATIMLSSGFDLQKAKTPIGALDKPQNLRAKHVDGVEGSVKLMVAPVPKADGYLWQYTEVPVTDASIWQTATSSPATVTLALKNRTEYTFRVTATGSDPTQTFSDKLSFFVV